MKNLTAALNTNTHNKLYGLDHLRALAIILVFLYHYQTRIFAHPAWANDVGKFGWTGVDLFFVLSGFLISSLLFSRIKKGERISLKAFFLKRFFRIIPAYLVVVAIYFCFPFFHERERLSPLWRFLTFTQNFGLDNATFGTFSHAWSLCVEEHFYFFLPMILFFMQGAGGLKKAYWLLIALFLFGFCMRYYCWNELYLPNISAPNSWSLWYKYVYYPTYDRLDGILAGISIAGIYHFLPGTWSKISKYGNRLLALGLVILTAAYFLCYDEHSFSASVFGFPLVAVGYGILVMGAISPTSFLYKWSSRITTFIATLSYSLYLVHKGIIHVVQAMAPRLNTEANSNLAMLICVISCIAVALILYYIIERPFMKLRKKFVAD